MWISDGIWWHHFTTTCYAATHSPETRETLKRFDPQDGADSNHCCGHVCWLQSVMQCWAPVRTGQATVEQSTTGKPDLTWLILIDEEHVEHFGPESSEAGSPMSSPLKHSTHFAKGCPLQAGHCEGCELTWTGWSGWIQAVMGGRWRKYNEVQLADTISMVAITLDIWDY